jgi:hypothetical protein
MATPTAKAAKYIQNGIPTFNASWFFNESAKISFIPYFYHLPQKNCTFANLKQLGYEQDFRRDHHLERGAQHTTLPRLVDARRR